MSWWDIGEGSGYDTYNGELRLDLVTCAFCGEEDQFAFETRVKKQNRAGKTLHYDTLRCEQCGNLTFVFWGKSTSSGLQRIHQVPWLTKTIRWPTHWPSDVGRYWLQARNSLETSNWDAAALMARSAVQLTLRYQDATGNSLYGEIEHLASKGVLPPVMVAWAHEVRVLGNDNAHPEPGSEGTNAADAEAVVKYLTTLLQFVYDLPHEIAQFRARKVPAAKE